MRDEIRVGSKWRSVVGGFDVTVEDVGGGVVAFGRDVCDKAVDVVFRNEFRPLANPKPAPREVPAHDAVANPAHYDFAIKPIDAVEAWRLNHRLSSAVEYIARHEGKGGVGDLEKAAWFLAREIAKQKEAAK